LFYFAKPVAERALLKAIYKQPIRSLVEIGIGRGERTARLLEVVGWTPHDTPLKYTGIDQFEGRPEGTPGMSLKEAFSVLKRPDVKMQLVPGDPHQALARTANMLAKTDLLVISADVDATSLARAWTYVPRMLHEGSLVYQQQPATAGGEYRRLTKPEIDKLTQANGRGQRRAA
jgi:hypothetical protein